MNRAEKSLSGMTWSRFTRNIRNLAASEVGWQAKGKFALLVAFLLGINGLNVLSSYVGRDFMSAVADREMNTFLWQGVLYVGVFALSTVAAVIYRYTEESLGLLWRDWLTRRLVNFYLDHRIYFYMDASGAVANPDQRIAEDVRSFTVTTLSFILMLLNGSFTVVAFSGVLWSISPLLFVISILYAVAGSVTTVLLGKTLVKLNYDQLDKEANFRSDLIHVRENAESVALLHREGRLRARLLRALDALVANFGRMININRNVGFFTTGYNYLIQVIPVLIVAPMYISGEAAFGVITQAAMAFTMLLGAFSLIVTQFQSISNYAAVGSRLSALAAEIEAVAPMEVKPAVGAACAICLDQGKATRDLSAPEGVRTVVDEAQISFDHVTLKSPRDDGILINDLCLDISPGMTVLIKGPSENAQVALFRALAGLWERGEGTIARPDLDHILFLTERPYLPPGTLRDLLVTSRREGEITEDQILQTLKDLDAGAILDRAGGLDEEHDWDDMFSLGEQQILAVARLLLAEPSFAVLDRPGTALTATQVRAILKMLTARSITYLTIGDGDDDPADYEFLLEFDADGNSRKKSRP